MNARYNNIPYRRIDNQAPRLFPPKPPERRFRVSVRRFGRGWEACLVGRWGVILTGSGGRATTALYDLERRMSEECIPETVQERQEAQVEIEARAREHEAAALLRGSGRAQLEGVEGMVAR